jgi:hypothetical protein
MMAGRNLIGYNTASTVIDGTSDMTIDGTTGTSGILPVGAKGALITVHGTGIRWRLDNTACSTGTGHYQASGSTITFDSWTSPGNDWRSCLKGFRFCPSSSGTCTIEVSYFD